jgi:hypothetical protein
VPHHRRACAQDVNTFLLTKAPLSGYGPGSATGPERPRPLTSVPSLVRDPYDPRMFGFIPRKD